MGDNMSNNSMFDSQTRTELHTHLLSMLSAENFVLLLEKYYPIIKDMLNNPNVSEKTRNCILEYYQLPQDEFKRKITIYNPIGSSETMSDYFKPRRLLLSVFSSLTKEYPFLKMLELVSNTSSSPEIKKHFYDLYSTGLIKEKEAVDGLIYSEYLNMALKELISQGVKYVEISYANLTIIKNLYITESIRKDIECRFMLCTNRDNIAFHFEPEKKSKKERKVYTFQDDAAPSLKEGLEWSQKEALADVLQGKQKNVIGFDIMGQELPFRDAELSRNPDSEVSFYNKLKIIIDILQNDYKNNHKMNTFRIHGGEVPGTENNILHTLTMLKELAPLSPLGFIPPPEIRIGHAVHFVDTPEYFDLLRKFGVIVEINATSNMKLSNIIKMIEIKYKRYIDERIPLVISTDGHGLYNTTIIIEDELAKTELKDDFDVVLATDEYVLNEKLRR